MGKRVQRNASIAVGYLRVSKGEQELGLDAQRTALEAWAKAQNVTVAAWCVDQGVKSTTSLEERPALLEAIARLSEHNAGLLLVARRDRLARDVLVSGLIERVVESSGSRVYSTDGAGNGQSPTDVFTKTILDAAGQLERSLIAARTKAALAEKKARGERLGQVPMAELLPRETVELIKNLYNLQGLSQAQVAAELNRRNVPTATGRGKWWVRTVQAALAIV